MSLYPFGPTTYIPAQPWNNNPTGAPIVPPHPPGTCACVCPFCGKSVVHEAPPPKFPERIDVIKRMCAIFHVPHPAAWVPSTSIRAYVGTALGAVMSAIPPVEAITEMNCYEYWDHWIQDRCNTQFNTFKSSTDELRARHEISMQEKAVIDNMCYNITTKRLGKIEDVNDFPGIRANIMDVYLLMKTLQQICSVPRLK
jgi:hypothetical protein